MKSTPDNIYQLQSWEIFVFGSNLAGRHWAGAALAAQKFGAVVGQGIGLVGKTYAIPTKDEDILTLPLHRIKIYVDQFITYAKTTPNLNFLVTKIGCGLAGYEVKDIAPLFDAAIDVPNIILPSEFIEYIIQQRLSNYLK